MSDETLIHKGLRVILGIHPKYTPLYKNGRSNIMVRKIYYLRRERYKDARECVDDLFKEKRCLIKPGNLIAFERGSRDFDEFTEKKLAELFGCDVKTLKTDDGKSWR